MLNYMNFIPRDPWFVCLMIFLASIAVYRLLVWAIKYRVTKRVSDHIRNLEKLHQKEQNDI